MVFSLLNLKTYRQWTLTRSRFILKLELSKCFVLPHSIVRHRCPYSCFHNTIQAQPNLSDSFLPNLDILIQQSQHVYCALSWLRFFLASTMELTLVYFWDSWIHRTHLPLYLADCLLTIHHLIWLYSRALFISLNILLLLF